MPEGEFEVRNRHGDVVQRGEIEVTGVHEMEHGKIVEVEFHDPAHMKHSDVMQGYVDLGDVLE